MHNALVHLSHQRGLSREQPASAHPLSLPRSASQKLAFRRIFSIKKNCRLAFPLTPPNEPFSGSQLMKNMPTAQSVCCKAHLKPVEDLRLCFALEPSLREIKGRENADAGFKRLSCSAVSSSEGGTQYVYFPHSLSFSFLSSVIKTCSPECCNRVLFSRLLWAPLSFYGSLGP